MPTLSPLCEYGGGIVGEHGESLRFSVYFLDAPRFSTEQELQPQTHLQIPLHRLQRTNRNADQQLRFTRMPVNRLQLKREHKTAGTTICREQHLGSISRCCRSLMRGDRADHDQFAGVVVGLHGNDQPLDLLFVSLGIRFRLESDDGALRGNARRISFPRAMPTCTRPREAWLTLTAAKNAFASGVDSAR